MVTGDQLKARRHAREIIGEMRWRGMTVPPLYGRMADEFQDLGAQRRLRRLGHGQLAQMGYEDRAGSYSYDLFERSIGRNLYRVDPDIPPLAASGAMAFYPGAPMTVAVADPPRALVLWQVTASGKAIDPNGPWDEGPRGVELGVCAGAGGCDQDPAAGPDAGQLPAGGRVGAVHVVAGRAGPLRHGPPPAPRS